MKNRSGPTPSKPSRSLREHLRKAYAKHTRGLPASCHTFLQLYRYCTHMHICEWPWKLGSESWLYRFVQQVDKLKENHVTAHLDGRAIHFPQQTPVVEIPHTVFALWSPRSIQQQGHSYPSRSTSSNFKYQPPSKSTKGWISVHCSFRVTGY